MVDPIKKILLKHPSNAFLNQRNINKQYLELNYLAAPNFINAISDYEIFVDLLKSFDIYFSVIQSEFSSTNLADFKILPLGDSRVEGNRP